MKSFAERLKELRQEQGLSQMQLAKNLNISDAIICKWEKNQSEPTAPNILLVANYFNVSVAYLLNQEDAWGNSPLTIQKSPDRELTEDETQVLNYYRQLTPEYKDAILSNLEIFSRKSQSTISKKA